METYNIANEELIKAGNLIDKVRKLTWAHVCEERGIPSYRFVNCGEELRAYEEELLAEAYDLILLELGYNDELSQNELSFIQANIIKAVKHAVKADQLTMATVFLKLLTNDQLQFKYKNEIIRKYIKKILAGYAKKSIIEKRSLRLNAVDVIEDAKLGRYGIDAKDMNIEALINMYNDTRVAVVDKYGTHQYTLKLDRDLTIKKKNIDAFVFEK